MPLSVCAAARAARLEESSSLLLLAAGLTPFLGPPALVALGIGLWHHRRALTVVSAATAGTLLVTALPGLGVPAGARPPAGELATFRVFSANVYDANPDVGRIAEEIKAVAPDLLALQEVNPDGAAALQRSGVLARFPYSRAEIRDGASGIGLWSRFPLAETAVHHVGGMPLIRATVILGDRRLRFFTVHTVAPWETTVPDGERSYGGSTKPCAVKADRWSSRVTSMPPAITGASGASFRTGWSTPTSGVDGDGRRPGRGAIGCRR